MRKKPQLTTSRFNSTVAVGRRNKTPQNQSTGPFYNNLLSPNESFQKANLRGT